MKEQIRYQFPILTIKGIKPLLSKNDRVFAYSVTAITEKGDTLTFYENKGLSLKDYIGQKMECLLEITKGKFLYMSEEGRAHKNTLTFKYQWLKRPYEFFDHLVKIREDLQEEHATKEDSMYQSFETAAFKFFHDWGLNGLQIGIYQDKPLLSSTDGIYLLNEYEFEEDIQVLELNRTVAIKIDEIYLRGIRPCIPLKSVRQKELITQPKPKEESQSIVEKAEPKEKKKGRFDSLLDIS